MTKLTPFLLTIALASPCLAQNPAPAITKAVIAPVLPVAAGNLFILDGTASVGDKFAWRSISGLQTSVDSSGKKTTSIALTPGTYQFNLLAIGHDKNGLGDYDEASVSVTVEGPTPPIPVPVPVPPGPGPAPNPAPEPITKPVAGDLYVCYIKDATALTTNDAVLERSAESGGTLATTLAGTDASWFSYMNNQTEITKYDLATKAGNAKAPYAVILNDKGSKVGSVLVNPDEASITALVKKLRGAK